MIQSSAKKLNQCHATTCGTKTRSIHGDIDQLDSFLNNMRLAIGGKKWYWMHMVNLVSLL